MSNQSDSLVPLVIAFVLVYALAVLIVGVLVDGTIALAFVTVGVMAVLSAVIGVEVFRKLDDGD
jgi:membrane protein implicated in regulation of membrane protease activity